MKRRHLPQITDVERPIRLTVGYGLVLDSGIGV